jgi:hypothetical protein
MVKFFIFAGSISAFLAVALGAFGAHTLKSKLSQDMMEVYQTGVQYHLIQCCWINPDWDHRSLVSLFKPNQLVGWNDFRRDNCFFGKFISAKYYRNSDIWCHYADWRISIFSRLDITCLCFIQKSLKVSV